NFSQTVADKPPTTNGTGNRFYSPLVLNIAASEGVSMTELENIPGTGNEGRVTKKDILQYVSERKSGRRQESRVTSREPGERRQEESMVVPFSKVESSHAVTTYSGNVEIIEMD